MSATPEESWVALLEEEQLVEIMFDRPDQGRLVGDIYLGRVEAVLPGIQAAFVDIGTDKAGFLHVSDLNLDDEELDDEDGNGNGGGRGRRKSKKYPPIQDHLKKGQELLVQVTKEPISTKGPRLTAQVSLPGRFLVYMPYSSHVGVSRKIDGRDQRAKLRKMAKAILPGDSGGMIVRTVGEEVTPERLEKEFKRLHAMWKKVQRRANSQKAPTLVHGEAKLISGVIRDLFSDKFDALRIDSKVIYNEIVQYVKSVDPDLMDRVHFYDEPVPLFDKYGIEEDIQQAFSRKVGLKSGGYVIIEPTEALVSIDVNTGRFTGKGKKDPEETILRTNLDAAREIAKHVRLRDVGGIIVVDFIDMNSQENRDRVVHELRSHLGRDRARTKVFEVSSLGLVEMTRQRVRPSLFHSLTEMCTSCGGSGRLYTPATVIRRIERSVKRAGSAEGEKKILVRVHPEVALQVREVEPDLLKKLSKRTKLELDLMDDPLMRQDEFRLLSGPAQTDVTDKYVVN
ncbi:MAG: Rne/Rng family ribonuclease [Gemmatimonadota bacterium]|nr:Rne/Rng family ribonuclease [Gemmatimonadota bacterium]